MKKTPLTLTIAGLLLVIFFVLLFCGQVRKSTTVVITTFDKPTRTIDKPGFYLRLPWPIQKAYTFDERIQNFDDRLEEAYTGDNFALLTMVYVGWRINNPQVFLAKYAEGSISEAENQMKPALRSAKLGVVGQHQLTDFVSTNQSQLKFAEIEKEILARVQKEVSTNGIEIKFLGLKKLGFPEAVTGAVFTRMTTERAVLSSKITSDGERVAAGIRSSADAESSKIIADAKAQATAIKGQALSEATKSFEIFQKNPDLANLLLDLQGLEAALKSRATLILDQHSQPFNLFQTDITNRSAPIRTNP